ncbi:YbhB/YbcL family Raf kinase inhibitor-like protein [candidate division WOR-3 bacterium]|nr:YbhB/YbcL family Raf kinase inhibitor-like protein [candidate division WOR-3 bacterium]
MKLIGWLFAIGLFLCCCGGAKTPPKVAQTEKSDSGSVPKMQLFSPAFAPETEIPVRYTGDGEDISPELVWDSVPDGVKSFALICSDPDAPIGTFVHWVIYNIPGVVRRLPEGVVNKEQLDDGTKQGVNSFQRIGYNGPKPPPGKPHRYIFQLYALDTILDLPPGASVGKLQEAMTGHIRAEARLVGIYGR